MRVERDGERLAVEVADSQASDACASSPVPASSCSSPALNVSRTGVLRSATRDTRLTASTSDGGVDRGHGPRTPSGSSARYLGNSPSSSRVVVRRPPPSKPIRPSPELPAASATATVSLPASDFAVSARVLAGTRATASRPGCSGAPGQLAHGQPVAVGGGQGHGVAVDLDPDAGEDGQRVVAAGGDRDLGDGVGERPAGDGAGDAGHLRQGGVVVDRQRQQGEPGAATAQLDPGPVGVDLHRLGRQAAGDVGEQPAGHQDRARARSRRRRPSPGWTPRSRSRTGSAPVRRPRPAGRRARGRAGGPAGSGRSSATASARTSRSTRNCTALLL